MRYLEKLFSRGALTQAQIDAAIRWRSNPMQFLIAPSAYRLLHDAIIKEMGAGEIEERNNLSQKSEGSTIGLILNCLIECDSFFHRLKPNQNEDHAHEIEYLTGKDPEERAEVFELLGTSGAQAQIFLILKKNNGAWIARDTIFDRLTFDAIDPPSPKIIDVHLSLLRKRLRERELPYQIESMFGVGVRLVSTEGHQGRANK